MTLALVNATLPARAPWLVRRWPWALVITLASATACAPPLETATRPRRARSDSLIEAEAGAKSPEWRATHYPVADLHALVDRPRLGASADTNDATAYYQLGDSVKWRLQGLADRAFYWAVRLDPTMSEAYFARWELRRQGTLYRVYPDGAVRRIDSRAPNEIVTVDSLLLSALVYNPFLDGVLDIPPLIAQLGERQANRDPATAGAWAYLHGDYHRAVAEWDHAIRNNPENVSLRVPRAYAWVHLDQSDSAVADLTKLIDQLERFQDSTIAPYASKAFLYYAVGILRAGQRRYVEARTAYENALLENLGFYMAHVRLSAVALLLQDTVMALNELETATLIRTDDPVLLAFRASILIGAGRFDDAERQLRTALGEDDDYALPRAFLGKLAEQRHDTAGARAAYRDYLAHASRAAPERAWVEEHLAALTSPPSPP